MAFFSVVIPTYNRSKLLINTIQSVLDQTFIDFEIIIVDDGSTDDTKLLIDEFFKNNKQIAYYWKKNEERAIARNFGIEKAHGQYIQLLDSDDWMKPNHLEVLYNHISRHPELNFITTKYNLVKNGIKINMPILTMKEGPYGYKDFLQGAPFGSLFCIKKSNPDLRLFSKNKNIIPLEDWIFAIQNTKTDIIFLLDEITIQINDHEGRSMANHELVIRKRIYASDYLIKKEGFNKNERKEMLGYSYYFCAIHAFFLKNKVQSIKFTAKSIYLLGPKSFLLFMIAKILIGQTVLKNIKKFFRKQ